jgi:hypothetical protein
MPSEDKSQSLEAKDLLLTQDSKSNKTIQLKSWSLVYARSNFQIHLAGRLAEH